MKKKYLPFLCLVLVLACAILFSSCTTVRAQSSDVNETSPGGDSAVLTNHFGQRLDEIIIGIPDFSYTYDDKWQDATVYYGFQETGIGMAVATHLFLYDDSTFLLEPSGFSSKYANYLFGSFSIDGNRLILALEVPDVPQRKNTDISALKISIVINNDESLTIVKDETSLPGFDFKLADDLILTKREIKSD